ncbi:MAG: hypothetical protein QF406_09075 [Verrucomicrobiota bacterium]|jgi:soluble cytochrome b562|nr:hypothetical protein [Verrucomicrobiota bacterium]
MEQMLSILLTIFTILLLIVTWNALVILKELNNRIKKASETLEDMKLSMKTTDEQIGLARNEVAGFTKELTPFFHGGRELIDDILKSKRESESGKMEEPAGS